MERMLYDEFRVNDGETVLVSTGRHWFAFVKIFVVYFFVWVGMNFLLDFGSDVPYEIFVRLLPFLGLSVLLEFLRRRYFRVILTDRRLYVRYGFLRDRYLLVNPSLFRSHIPNLRSPIGMILGYGSLNVAFKKGPLAAFIHWRKLKFVARYGELVDEMMSIVRTD